MSYHLNLQTTHTVMSHHRGLDVLLGVFTGAFAYYLYENNPRTAPLEGDRLVNLLKWKKMQWQKAMEKEDVAVDERRLEELLSSTEAERK